MNDPRYKTHRWVVTRRQAMQRDNYECQMCKEEGMFKPGEVVHHIKPSDKYPDLMYEIDNLQTLCRPCHERVHGREPIANTRFPERW